MFLLLALGCGSAPVSVYADPSRQAIVGGGDADLEDHPAMVSLVNSSGEHFCGGTLIADDWVLTAAHCLLDRTASMVRIEHGEASLDAEGDLYDVERMRRHPDHRRGDHADDVALLQLSSPVPDAQPLPLLSRTGALSHGLPGDWATVAGWGQLEVGGDYPDLLQEVDVPLIDLQSCIDQYPDRVVLDTMVCAGDLVDGGEDACTGDSGGPLTVETPNGPVLLGVVSWGIGCADADRPGVYARVPSFVNWIQHVVSGVNLDDFGDSPDHADPVSNGTHVGVLGDDDVDVFALDRSGTHDVLLSSTGAQALSVTVYDASRTVVASEHGVANFELALELTGPHFIEIGGAPQTYTLHVSSTPVPSDSSGGCGSSLWSLATGLGALSRP